MIKTTKQEWEIGQKVNVGFLKGLTVTKKVATPGDYMPDAYELVSDKGVRYEFVPHNGIHRLY